MYLVMLETNGNQRYIFSSPRLRENIGASAQLVRLKEWTDKALKESGAEAAWRQKTHTPTAGPANGDDANDLDFIIERTEWVSRASGKVIFMVKTEDFAKAVIGQVTRTALAQAPGIDVSGVYINMGDQSTITEDLLKNIHAVAAAYALRRSPAQARFSQMPFLARAKDSSFPAAPPLGHVIPGGLKDEAADDIATAHSLPSRVKRYQAYHARKELISLACNASSVLKYDDEPKRLVRDPTKLAEAYRVLRADTDETRLRETLQMSFNTGINRLGDKGENASNTDVTKLERILQDSDGGKSSNNNPTALSKVAVIHADGNGVGAIMRNLEAAIQCVPKDEFKKELGCTPQDSDAFRRFTLAVSGRLDQAVAQAFASAWADVAVWAQIDAWLQGRSFPVVPVVPVILGGDDVTVITSGDYALPFAASFLAHLEEQTEKDALLKYLHAVGKVATEEVTPAPMTAAAGVAVVRRTFPFHIAYELAEKLVGRAKAVGKNQASPCSTLDFHVLFDTTVIDSDHQLGSYKSFTQRPFRLKPAAEKQPTSVGASESQEAVTWQDMCCRVARFQGFRDTDNETDKIEPFPRTRAARIRKLLSDGKQDEAAKHEATKHWEAAKKVVPRDSEIASGGSKSLFDLLELADLLPDVYLQQVTGLKRPKDTSTTSNSGAHS